MLKMVDKKLRNWQEKMYVDRWFAGISKSDMSTIVWRCYIAKTTPLLHSLHWLPVEKRIEFKYACICYKIFNGTSPSYLSDLIKFKQTKRQGLRSETDKKLFEPPSKFPQRAKHGSRAFKYASSHLWNSLPLSVRNSPSYCSFRSNLKTHLFKSHFSTF